MALGRLLPGVGVRTTDCNNMAKMTIRVPDELNERIERAAEATHRSKTSFMLMAAEEKLKRLETDVDTDA